MRTDFAGTSVSKHHRAGVIQKSRSISRAAFSVQLTRRLKVVVLATDDIDQSLGLDRVIEYLILFEAEIVERLFGFVVAFVGFDSGDCAEPGEVYAAAEFG
jgi:hypothetical protein